MIFRYIFIVGFVYAAFYFYRRVLFCPVGLFCLALALNRRTGLELEADRLYNIIKV